MLTVIPFVKFHVTAAIELEVNFVSDYLMVDSLVQGI